LPLRSELSTAVLDVLGQAANAADDGSEGGGACSHGALREALQLLGLLNVVSILQTTHHALVDPASTAQVRHVKESIRPSREPVLSALSCDDRLNCRLPLGCSAGEPLERVVQAAANGAGADRGLWHCRGHAGAAGTATSAVGRGLAELLHGRRPRQAGQLADPAGAAVGGARERARARRGDYGARRRACAGRRNAGVFR